MKHFTLLSTILLLWAAQLAPIQAQNAAECEAGFHLFAHEQLATDPVCIPDNPQRVVVLDTGELDNALALGASVIGAPITDVLTYQDYLVDDLEGISDTGQISTPNLEAILALEPDLILGSMQRYEGIYEQLSQIAPTVLTQTLRTAWQDNFQLHAAALGKTAEAEQMLADYASRIANIQAGLGDRLDSQTVSVVRFFPGSVSIYLNGSYIGRIIQEIGLARPATQDQDVFRLEISLEEVQQVDADYIFVTGYSLDDSERDTFLNSPLWQTLNAVQSGHVVEVNDDTWMAGLGVQSANLVLNDLETLFEIPTAQSVSACDAGLRAVVDATDATVCIPENPQRVVGLMEADVDALLALGITPVGSTNGRGQLTPPRYLADYLTDVASVGQFYSPNLEVLLELEPDLILFGGFTDETVLAQLNAIAPTVNTLQNGESWQSHFERVAAVMDMSAEADVFIADYDARIAEIQAELGDNASDSFIVARWSAEGPQIMAPTLTFSSGVLLDLGLSPAPEIPELQEGHPHSAPLSLEALELLDVDWAFIGTLSPEGDALTALEDALENPLFQSLEVAQNEHVILIDGSLWTSVGGPLAAALVLDDVEAALAGGE